MTQESAMSIGTIGWMDLTVADATAVSSFYADVVGWEASPMSMGDYDDYAMMKPGGEDCAAGICHARGANSKLPPQWLLYISVPDVDASAQKAVDLGGTIIDGPRPLGEGRFCVISDPAGAVCALWNPNQAAPAAS